MTKIRIATIWLDGCSGCHMSLLDCDHQLLELTERLDLVYGPLVDTQEFPDQVDVVFVEGAVATGEDVITLRKIRENSRILVAFGDCAVTSNVPAMRNEFGLDEVLRRSYGEDAPNLTLGHRGVPKLLPKVLPIQEYVAVDVFLPGCPPPADAILYAVNELLDGRLPDLSGRTRFGA